MEEIKVQNQMDEMFEEPSGEDMLLAQIDAFRDKAKQLQTLISAKERKVKELEAMVRAKEERNSQLQEELAKKQAEADGIAADVETQVDRMMQTLRGSVDDLEERIQQQVADNQEKAAVQTQAVKDTLEDMTSGLDAIKGELSEKVHSENVLQYRNIQDLLKELDNREEAAKKSEEEFSVVKKRITMVTVVSVLNVIAVVTLILATFGII
ncbi:MAG: hypothetical protein UEY91_05965 [Lachnospiraceae bacterium]|nr:hypothetical protein [Pseudobutyrivibrio sp.]MEE0106322.1 hypothetical protein [Lachnospiraceae bacterium]